ncbi:hypothetical protein BGZ94_007322 [Podila epigama]|nr:hypothetical protein BGZ94_007322 [Podila epigama]
MAVKDAEDQLAKRKEAISNAFSVTATTSSAIKSATTLTSEDKAASIKAKAEQARAAIAEAKANIAKRSSASAAMPKSSEQATSNSAAAPPPPPKVKKASRVVSLMKMKKNSQGEDTIPMTSRLYFHIRSPTFPQLNEKAVYVNKTWTVGHSLDKIVEWLKFTIPKNEPFDAKKVINEMEPAKRIRRAIIAPSNTRSRH